VTVLAPGLRRGDGTRRAPGRSGVAWEGRPVPAMKKTGRTARRPSWRVPGRPSRIVEHRTSGQAAPDVRRKPPDARRDMDLSWAPGDPGGCSGRTPGCSPSFVRRLCGRVRQPASRRGRAAGEGRQDDVACCGVARTGRSRRPIQQAWRAAPQGLTLGRGTPHGITSRAPRPTCHSSQTSLPAGGSNENGAERRRNVTAAARKGVAMITSLRISSADSPSRAVGAFCVPGRRFGPYLGPRSPLHPA
jgi:hypothetical protein